MFYKYCIYGPVSGMQFGPNEFAERTIFLYAFPFQSDKNTN